MPLLDTPRCLLLMPVLLALGCIQEGAPEVHLLPEGYTGVVYIVHEAPDGVHVDPAHREYRVGPEGILAVDAPANPGVFTPRTQRFFYVARDGSRRELPSFGPLPEHAVQVYNRGAGSFGGWSKRDCSQFVYLQVTAYVVGRPDVLAPVERSAAAQQEALQARYFVNPRDCASARRAP